MQHTCGQIVGGISRRPQTAAVLVDGRPARVIVETIIRLRPVAEDCGLIVGRLRLEDRLQRENCREEPIGEGAAKRTVGLHTFWFVGLSSSWDRILPIWMERRKFL